MLGDEYFMKLALKQAEIGALEGEVPVGAVLVHNGQILAKAHNQTEVLTDVTAHAEMLCITAGANAIGAKYLKDCVLYVTLEPCAMCAGALAWSQIGRIVYAASDIKKGYTTYKPNLLHPKTQIEFGIFESEAEHLLKVFFLQQRKSLN